MIGSNTHVMFNDADADCAAGRSYGTIHFSVYTRLQNVTLTLSEEQTKSLYEAIGHQLRQIEREAVHAVG